MYFSFEISACGAVGQCRTNRYLSSRFLAFVDLFLITEIWDPIREFEEKRKRSVEGER